MCEPKRGADGRGLLIPKDGLPTLPVDGKLYKAGNSYCLIIAGRIVAIFSGVSWDFEKRLLPILSDGDMPVDTLPLEYSPIVINNGDSDV